MDIMEPILKTPVLNTKIKTGKYVLVAVDYNGKRPIEYSNDHNKLLKKMEKIAQESVFKFDRINLAEMYSEDLDITYKVILTDDLFK